MYSVKNLITELLLCFNFENEEMTHCLSKYIYNGGKYSKLKQKKSIYLNNDEKMILKDLNYILYYQTKRLKKEFPFFFSHSPSQWIHDYYPGTEIKIDFYEIYNENHFKIYLKDFSLKKRFAHLEIIHSNKGDNIKPSQSDQSGFKNVKKSENECNVIYRENHLKFSQKNWRVISFEGFFE